jgi:hypothetical protein
MGASLWPLIALLWTTVHAGDTCANGISCIKLRTTSEFTFSCRISTPVGISKGDVMLLHG